MMARQVSDMFDLSGRVAVVTGGSRGIGHSIAMALSRAGASVVVASRKIDACERAASAIQTETGNRTSAIACHVGRWDDCQNLLDSVTSEYGRCDILVNNAGMSPRYESLVSVTEEYYDKVAAVNLKGPFRLGALFGDSMTRTGRGSIINVSTIGSLRPGADELVYACAKAGLNALTVGLAEAYGPHVRTNAILPGGVATDIAANWPPGMLEEAITGTPLARIGVPDDFVGAATWLASDASSFVTGALIRIDGGRYRQTS
ncbi:MULTISPECIES: glucose 1-dehydrogenase [Rhodococcus]|uniref:Glucose 1-dehydrogenase n=1 Tax=Rhodococcus oxybenzonivorans TaxID=1990687 RepID=A0AAE5A6S5_9NOCA|nr:MULTISPECIES: glucose 1-dehydrogenase [Rhodococcus]MDV7240544.1 glucose 1-dehydrogenase [Rhodococcus oxybenzonivorans]MDV7265761.1 glucose 1-dehydrogenase [Rhodococcus oxybenzonivorans]MDV7272817.1 glucose 1-dehydrogenase [Rhodococcus oxybenzonivorans]MDV7333444.1 glucose 1-dehydrogenase [Rhodococcus oxybenzonivorans]MDV7342611.1 glucose 1-dehydrogenase [Rhodococcus oxybenzonivorans]